MSAALKGSFLGNTINVKGFRLNNFSESEITICTDPIETHVLQGVTSSGDEVTVEPSMIAGNGSNFVQESDFYYAPLQYLFKDGVSMEQQVAQDIVGAGSMQLYYNYNPGNGNINGLGFLIANSDGSTTFALREFTATFNNNNIIFTFNPAITLFGSQTPDANINNINIYLDALTQGNNTYVFRYDDNIYEFHNPCTGWSFVFLNGDN